MTISDSSKPISSIEACVKAAFEAALDKPLGKDADFFDEGGDSLTAEQLFLALEQSLGLEVPSWILLDHSSIKELSQALEEMASTKA